MLIWIPIPISNKIESFLKKKKEKRIESKQCGVATNQQLLLACVATHWSSLDITATLPPAPCSHRTARSFPAPLLAPGRFQLVPPHQAAPCSEIRCALVSRVTPPPPPLAGLGVRAWGVWMRDRDRARDGCGFFQFFLGPDFLWAKRSKMLTTKKFLG